MAKISVIIPTYGEPCFLPRTIQSVLNQTIYDFELIVVDDNNPGTPFRQKTEKLVYEIQDRRLIYLQHPYNKNGAAARNTGIDYARGEFIAFLDSDDEYMPERLEKCLACMEHASPDIAGVYTGCEFRRGGKTYNTFSDVKAGNFLIETLACTFMFCTGSNLFVRSSVVKELNGFDESFLRHQDYEFLTRLFEKYSLDAIQEILVIKNNENLNLPDVNKMADIKKQYLDKYQTLILKLSEEEQRKIYHAQFLQLAEAALRSGRKKEASRFYKTSEGYCPLTVKEQMRRQVFNAQNLLYGIKK